MTWGVMSLFWNLVARVAAACLTVMAMGTAPAFAEYVGDLPVDSPFLSVRTAPGVAFQELTRLDPGTYVYVLGSQGRWRRIRTQDGKEGWVAVNYLRLDPKFLDYPTEIYRGPRAPITWDSSSWNYRTRLHAATGSPPNFGNFVLTTWGCGTSCETGAVINAATGKVVLIPFTVCCALDSVASTPDFERILFKRDSRLVVFAGLINEKGVNGAHFYEFDGSSFKLVTTRPFLASSPSATASLPTSQAAPPPQPPAPTAIIFAPSAARATPRTPAAAPPAMTTPAAAPPAMTTVTALAAQLAPTFSASMRDELIALLQDQFTACFNRRDIMPVAVVQPGTVLWIQIEFSAPDGRLVGPPTWRNPSKDPSTRTLAEAFLVTITRCAPYKIPQQFVPFFENWKDTTFQIDAKDFSSAAGPAATPSPPVAEEDIQEQEEDGSVGRVNPYPSGETTLPACDNPAVIKVVKDLMGQVAQSKNFMMLSFEFTLDNFRDRGSSNGIRYCAAAANIKMWQQGTGVPGLTVGMEATWTIELTTEGRPYIQLSEATRQRI